jgi:hypothetical protein
MSRPKTYKKHMRPATHLFWFPKTEHALGIHWRLDADYSILTRDEFDSCDADDVMRNAFSNDGELYEAPPTATSDGTSNTDAIDSGDHSGPPRHPREFLVFPDGFCASLRSGKSQVPVVGRVRGS